MRKTLLSLSLCSFLLGGEISQEQIDTNKNVIQIASSKSLLELISFSKRFANLEQDIYFRNYKDKYHILYAVNVESNILKQTLKNVRKKSPSAFVTRELSIYLKSITEIPNEVIITESNNTEFKQVRKVLANKTKPINQSSNETIPVRIVNSDRRDLDPMKLLDTDNLYKKAIYSYNKKDFKDAYRYFSQYSQKSSMDKRGNFFYARSAFESSYYHEALAIYGKILLQDPDNVRVKLEIGQCYFRLKEYKEAKNSFNEVLKEKLPNNVKQNVIAMLRTIDAKDIKHFTQTLFMLSYQYDSNVDNSADAGEYTIYLPSSSSNVNMNNDGEKTSDSSLQAVISFTHNYKYTEDTTIETKVTGFTQKYRDQTQKNVDVLSLESSLVKYSQKDKISGGLGYSYIALDSKSYMNIPYLKLGYDYKISPSLTYQGYLKLSDKNYTQEDNKTRDSHAYELYNSLSLATEKFGVNTLSLTLGREDKVRGIRTDVTKDYYSLNLANNYSLTQTLLLKSSIDYELTFYKDTDVNFLNKREDKQTTVSLGLMKSLDKSTTLGTNIEWTDNSSNHEPFDYDKYVLKGFMYYGF